jgi:hypothetical protein
VSNLDTIYCFVEQKSLEEVRKTLLKTAKNMTLPDVTEQRLAIHLVFSWKKTPRQISAILEEAENMFKSTVHFKYMI